MQLLLAALPGNEVLTKQLALLLAAEQLAYTLREFPDAETYLRLHMPVAGRTLVLVCTLARPNPSLLPLYLLAQTARDLGARQVYLVAPYLAYMRQDARFRPGEGITSRYFAQLLSGFVDGLVTVDPHLHRWHHLREIYPIPTQLVHAAGALAGYLRQHVSRPVLLGPDSESSQWVQEVAQAAGCPYLVLQKQRHSDRDVEVTPPDMTSYPDHTPVIVDDIISTAHTMIACVQQLRHTSLPQPVCVGIHALFAGTAYQELVAAGAGRIITCDTVPHPSNGISVAPLLAVALRQLVQE